MDTLLWTWGGVFFGYKDQTALWTYDGRNIGWFINEEIYGMDGIYLGEIEDENRLITHVYKKHLRAGVYAPYGRRGSMARYANYAGYAMYASCEDFPNPESFSE